MRDVTIARGSRARQARRRAEKEALRRLEAAASASMDVGQEDLADTATDETPAARTSTEPANAFAADEGSNDRALIGLVAGVQRGGELSVLVEERVIQAKLSRELLQQQVAITVGDRVRVLPGKDGRPAVIGVEPRRTRLARIREDRSRRSAFAREEAVLAANVDIAVIVAAVAQPPFHPKLVDRFLVICQYGGISPVLCLNKFDLVESAPDVSIYEQLGLPIVYTSAATGQGLEQLRELLRGRITVFTGHSGVGKSSLVNALLGDSFQVVGAVRGADGRGRHTTTSSTLLRWHAGSFVVDTPGVRSLGVWRIEPTTLAWYFPEVAALSAECRFSTCSHTHEPDCGVKAATESGEIPRQRYESYVRMMDG